MRQDVIFTPSLPTCQAKKWEGLGLPFLVEFQEDGIDGSVRPMHVGRAGYVPDTAPDFDEAVLDDVGVRRFLHRRKGIRSGDGNAIKIGLKRGKFVGRYCRITSLWP
jgi:hypothetical protein